MLLSSTSPPLPPPSSSSIEVRGDANINDDELNIRSTPINDHDDDDDNHNNNNNTSLSPSSTSTLMSSTSSLSATSSVVGDDPKPVQHINGEPPQPTPATTTTGITPLQKSLLANEDDELKVDLSSGQEEDDELMSDKASQNKAEPATEQVDGDDDKMEQTKPPSVELRFLVRRREAGALIGKRGSNIKRLRDTFKETSFSIPDTGNGPERVVCILTGGGGGGGGDVDALDSILNDLAGLFLEKSGQYDDQIELKLLIHSSHAGSIIGIGGQSIKKLRNDSKAAIKIYELCCPFSSERVCAIKAKPPVVVNTIKLIQTILAENPIKGPVSPYDALNFDLSLVDKYGGYLPDDYPSSAELLIQARPPPYQQALFAGHCSSAIVGQCPPSNGHRRQLLNSNLLNHPNQTTKHYNSVWRRQTSPLANNKTPMSAVGGQQRQQVASANKNPPTQEAPTLRNMRFHPYTMPRIISASVPSASSHYIGNNHPPPPPPPHHLHHHHPPMLFKQQAFGVHYQAGQLANCQSWRQAGSPTTTTTTTTTAIGHHQVAAVAEAAAAAAAAASASASMRSHNQEGPLLAPCPCLFLPMAAAAYHQNHHHHHHNHHLDSTTSGHQSQPQATATASRDTNQMAGPSLSPPDMTRRNS